MKKHFLLLFIVVLFWGCNYPGLINDKFELYQAMGRELTLLTNDSLKYNLTSYKIGDSLISGEGYLLNQKDKTVFSGDILYDSIQYIQINRYNFAKSLIFTGMIITAGILLSESFHNEMNVEPEVIYTGPSGGSGSCPYILSRKGDEYILDGEAFSIGLGKALEMKTNTMLYNLGDQEEKVVKILNERPETHYFNSISINSVLVPENSIPVFDSDSNIFPVTEIKPPLLAVDKGNGKDITSEISLRDQKFWESDLSGATQGNKFRDVIELEFESNNTEGEVSFFINAQNTFLANAVFENLGTFLEGDLLDFYHSVETDPEMIRIMKRHQKNTFLNVSIWNGKDWEIIGELFPEGNMAPFSKVVRFNIPQINGDKIKIRLSSLSDVWKIDQAGIDFTNVKSLPVSEIKDVRVTKNSKSIEESVSISDDKYEFLLPGESIDISFNGLEEVEGYSRFYYAGVEGYLYEWISGTNETKFQTVSQGKNKISLLKSFLANDNPFLPIVYEKWKTTRKK